MNILFLVLLAALVFVTVAFVRESRIRRALEALLRRLLGKERGKS